MGVVNSLEMIQINDGKGKMPGFSLKFIDYCIQPFKNIPPVADAGQMIMDRDPPEPFYSL